MAAATATPSSSTAHNNPWDEEIVPALRKRLEAESQRLGKRMSRMLADDAVHPLGPMPLVAEAKPRSANKTSNGSSRTQGSLRSVSGPAPKGNWDETLHEEMPSGAAGASGSATNIEQAREKARRLRQTREGGSVVAVEQADGRRRSRQASEALPSDEWDGFYEPTSSKAAAASRSRTVSTPMKPSGMAARRRDERERMERENQELFGVSQNDEPASSGRKRAQQQRQSEQHADEQTSADPPAKVRRSTSQSILQPSSSSTRLGSNHEASTTDSSWSPNDRFHTPRKQQQQRQQIGQGDARSSQLRPPVASPGFASASAPVSPAAQRSISTSRRHRQGASAAEALDEASDFGPLGGTPSRHRSQRRGRGAALQDGYGAEAEVDVGDASMQSNYTHTSSAWDEQLIPTVARRLQQQQLMAVAREGGAGVGGGEVGEDGSVLIDTWDRRGMPLSASERAMKRREREGRERETRSVEQQREEDERRKREKDESAERAKAQEHQLLAPDPSQPAQHQPSSSSAHHAEGTQQQHLSQKEAAAALAGARPRPEAESEAKRRKEEDVGAGCCKCSVM